MVVMRWFLLLLGLCLGACLKHKADYGGRYEAEESYSYDDDMEYDAAPAMAKERAKRSGGYGGLSAMAAPAPPPYEAEPEPTSVPVSVGEDGAASGETKARMVHYDGYAQLRVTRADEAIDGISALTTELGGRVERVGADHITVRIPVAEFDAAFGRVLELGEVLSKSVTAEDVTEAFSAVELRLHTARATRDRLQELLARAKDEKEKIQLLREIQRLTEQIDRMESQRRTLASLASMSRISVSLASKDALASGSTGLEVAGFEWIGRLSPFDRSQGHMGRALVPEVPTGMVALDESKKRLVAESADGTVFWTARLDNQPEGTARFWMDAIQGRLAAEFGTAEESTVGRFLVLRMMDTSPDPYTYVVAISVDGDDIDLVQVYYPSTDQEARYGEAVLSVLQEVKG